MENLEPIKRDLVTASHIVHQQGLVGAYGHVSARVPGTNTFLFPARMSPALVRLENLLVLDVEGNQLSGDGRPNTEFWIHARIYKARPDVQSICHIHPPNCTVLSSLGETIRAIHYAGAIFKDGVPVFDHAGMIRSRELGDAVGECLGPHRAMLLRGHGANVVDDDVRRACMRALWLEEAADYQLRAMAAGKPRHLNAEELERFYSQVSEGAVVDRAWDYFKSLL
jgi:HCOMODA/2-hydroxy-3-carboxy-muconic semialdehyde decarboxylase